MSDKNDSDEEKTITYCVSLPINGPINNDWPALTEALRQAWGMSTRLANWAVTELLKRDPGRRAGDTKLRPMPAFDLYHHAFVSKRYPDWKEWEGAKPSAASVLRPVLRKYLKERFKVQWTGERAAASYRYPAPWPVHNQSWSAFYSADGQRRPCVSLMLPGGRFDVRLRGGPEFARQLRSFDMLVKGTVKQGQLTITRQLTHGSNRFTMTDREAGGAAKQQFREMVRIAVTIPQPAAKGRDRSLLVSTDANAFWVVQSDGRDVAPWFVNADHVRRREAEHTNFLQRISEDFKPEKRWPKHVRVQMNQHRDARCQKHNRFIDTWTKRAAAMLVTYCRRQGVGLVVYDDSCHSYCPGFPWRKQRDTLINRLALDGVEVMVQGKESTDEVA